MKFLRYAVVLTFLTSTAWAQDVNLTDMVDRLERMDRDLKALNLKVFRGDDAAAASVASSGGQAESLSGPLGARLSIRINELEGQMRQMTGQIEETTFRISQLNARLDKLVADVDYRLTALEQGAGVAPVAQGQTAPTEDNFDTSASATTPTGIGAAPLNAPSGEQATPAVPAPAAGPSSLGTIAPQDLAALENRTVSSGTPAPATSPETASAPATGQTPKQAYEAARQQLIRGDVVSAEQGFKDFLGRHQGHDLTGNVRYWLGETYYVQGNYTQAAAVFLEGYQKDEQGAKAPDSLLKLGMSLRRIERLKESCAAFDQLRAAFPKMPAHLSKTLERERSAAQCS